MRTRAPFFLALMRKIPRPGVSVAGNVSKRCSQVHTSVTGSVGSQCPTTSGRMTRDVPPDLCTIEAVTARLSSAGPACETMRVCGPESASRANLPMLFAAPRVTAGSVNRRSFPRSFTWIALPSFRSNASIRTLAPFVRPVSRSTPRPALSATGNVLKRCSQVQAGGGGGGGVNATEQDPSMDAPCSLYASTLTTTDSAPGLNGPE